MSDLTVVLEDSANGPTDFFQKWLDLIHGPHLQGWREATAAQPALDADILENIGFTDILRRDDGKLDATYNGVRYLGICLKNSELTATNLSLTITFGSAS